MSALQLGPEYDWQVQAACAKRAATPTAQRTFADRYFSGRVTNEQREECGGCLVREACLSHALAYDEPGIWAGTTKSERDAMKGVGQ